MSSAYTTILAAINGGKKKGLENVDFKAWEYIDELCSLYKGYERHCKVPHSVERSTPKI